MTDKPEIMGIRNGRISVGKEPIMADRRKALKELREKLKVYPLKYSEDEALKLAKERYFDTHYRNGDKKGYVTFDEIEGNVLYQTVFTLSNENVVKLVGITAYDKGNELYMTRFSDGEIKPDREARTWAERFVENLGGYYSLHYEEKEAVEKRSQFLFGDDEHNKPLFTFVEAIRQQKKDELKNRKIDEFKALNKKIKKPSKDFVRFMESMRFQKMGQIFFKDKECFCTDCGKVFSVKVKPKHRKKGVCPKCGEEKELVSRNKLKHNFFFYRNGLLIEKVDDEHIVMRLFEVECDLVHWSVKPQFKIRETFRVFLSDNKIQSFKINFDGSLVPLKLEGDGYGQMFFHDPFNKEYKGLMGALYTNGLYELCNTHPVLMHIDLFGYLSENLDSIQSQKKAVFRTVQYAITQLYYRPLESLRKSGFVGIVKEINNFNVKISDVLPNRSAKSLPKAIGLDKAIYNRLYKIRDRVTSKTLKIARSFPGLSDDDWDYIERHFFFCLKEIGMMLSYCTFTKLRNYLDFVHERYDIHYSTALNLWKDYINYLNNDVVPWDKKNTMLLFPKNLREKHDEYVEAARLEKVAKETMAEKGRIMSCLESMGISEDTFNTLPYKDFISSTHVKRLPDFMKLDAMLPDIQKEYSFEDSERELIVKAPETSYDIVKEGDTQHICVGDGYQRYIEKMADKETTILFVRKKELPNAPYYTLEVRDGKINQVKGKYNHAPDDEMKDFVAEFAREKNLEYNKAVY